MRSRLRVGAGAATVLGIVAVIMFVVGGEQQSTPPSPTAGALLAASKTPAYRHASRVSDGVCVVRVI